MFYEEYQDKDGQWWCRTIPNTKWRKIDAPRELIKAPSCSADWLENCAECMEDEGLDRDNNATHFRNGAKALRNQTTLVAALVNARKCMCDLIDTDVPMSTKLELNAAVNEIEEVLKHIGGK